MNKHVIFVAVAAVNAKGIRVKRTHFRSVYFYFYSFICIFFVVLHQERYNFKLLYEFKDFVLELMRFVINNYVAQNAFRIR